MTQPQEPFKRIGVDEAKRLIDEGKVRLVDVREPDEWTSGHIPQATHIPKSPRCSAIRTSTTWKAAPSPGSRAATRSTQAPDSFGR